MWVRRLDGLLLLLMCGLFVWAFAQVFVLRQDAGALLRLDLHGQIDPARDPQLHAKQRRLAEIDRRFQQAVAMLHAKQYQHASVALHRVLELAPKLPQAHVNMGYAMLGLHRDAVARDFFMSAIDLKSSQLNAYYGLALSLERLGDLAAAKGAMRTYVHLSKPDDPFLPKARAALWEWQAQ